MLLLVLQCGRSVSSEAAVGVNGSALPRDIQKLPMLAPSLPRSLSLSLSPYPPLSLSPYLLFLPPSLILPTLRLSPCRPLSLLPLSLPSSVSSMCQKSQHRPTMTLRLLFTMI